MAQSILVTGGTGYIASHTIIQLLNQGYHVIALDNLSNSSPKVIDRIEKICGKRPIFVEGDIRDRAVLKHIFTQHSIQAIIHFAGLKAVGESAQYPLKYYDNNVAGSIILFEEMQLAGVKTIVFSSSATVYGTSGQSKCDESMPTGAINVYGRCKLMVEEILRDAFITYPDWRIALLRYFNPVGAHHSGLIGEQPNGIPNNIMPYITQVAIGKLEKLSIFGNDYPTPDGTGQRDYIHVEDLASGHLAALNALKQGQPQCLTVNLGTGTPYSVLELVKTFESMSGRSIPYQFTERRAGDLATIYADPNLAKKVLNWQTQYTIEQMCADSWRWQQQNPNGYE